VKVCRWVLPWLLLSCTGTARPRLAGAYRFACTPPDAHLIVDEVDQGPCLLWQDRWLGLVAGTHRVRIVREGFFPQESEVVPNGRRVTVRAALRAVPE
jgi:hypothetical protein